MNDDLRAQWHQAACERLEAQVSSRTFFLLVSVEPEQAGRAPATTPNEVEPLTWEAIAESVERWLEALDPDAIGEDNVPKLEVRPGDTLVELTAVPKKRSRRGADPLIANPYPGMANFPAFYSSGPPPELDDGS